MIAKVVFEPVSYENMLEEYKSKIIPSFIFLKQKYKPNGDLDKVKARLAAGGNMQGEQIYGA